MGNKKFPWGMYFIVSFLIILIMFGFYYFVADNVKSTSVTYTGKHEFETIDEAVTFLQKVSEEAHKVNGVINNNEFTLMSPPTVYFSVTMPIEKFDVWNGAISQPFKYGAPRENIVKNFRFMPFIIIVMAFLFNYFYIKRMEKENAN